MKTLLPNSPTSRAQRLCAITLIFFICGLGQIATAQLFENLERFGSRLDLGDPAVISDREGPKSVCLNDIDSDGKRDVIASNLDGTVSVSYGEGGLKFDQVVHLQTGALTLRGLLCVDLNGDTLPDVATAAPEEGIVHLFFNEGSRRFSEPTQLNVWRTVRNLTAGDFNGDGNIDLALAGRDGGVQFYYGNGNSEFEAGISIDTLAVENWWGNLGYKPVYSLRVARASGSSKDELVVTHSESDTLWVIGGADSPAITTQIELNQNPHSIEVGVVESDNLTSPPNLLTADKRLGTIEIRKAASPEVFSNGVAFEEDILQTIRVPGAPRDMKLADLNGDGWNDLVVALRNFDRVLTYRNNGGTFEPVAEIPVGKSPRELATGDIDGDEVSDFVVINRISRDASILLTQEDGNGPGVLDQVYPVTGEVAALELHDVNGDGRSDVIQMHRSSGDVSVRMANSSGKMSAPDFYHMGVLPSGFELKDLNRDGTKDLLTANLGRNGYIPGSVSIRYGTAEGTFGDRIHVPTDDGARIFAVESADFDLDGLDDFAVGYFDCRIAFYQGQADGSFKYTRTDRFTYESRVMVTGDFDQDGDFDIAGAGYAGDVVVLENEGDLLTTEVAKRRDYRPLSSKKFGTREITALDVNDDGDLDLLVGSGDGVLLLTGAEGTSFKQEKEALKGTEFPASSLAQGDFDSDGIDDLAVSCRVLACVVILKGDGTGGFDPALVVDVPAGEFVRTGDVDGDGLTDLVGSGSALWVALSSHAPEEGPAWTEIPKRAPLPKVVINEVLASNNRYRFPGAQQETPDAIELFNGSESTVNLHNWLLRRTQTSEFGTEEIREFKLPADAVLESGKRLVLYCSKQERSRFHTGFKLPSSGAKLELLDKDGTEVDNVTYPPLELNISFCRYQDGIPSFRHNMFPDIGSTNVDNGALEPTVYFDGFDDTSELKPNQPIKMTARANDDVGVIALSLVYQKLGLAPDAGIISRAVLYDDGEHGDGDMLDGVFAGEFPPVVAGTEIQFYLEAVDLNNKIVTMPGDPFFASTAEGLRHLYTFGVGIPAPSIEISEIVTDNESLTLPATERTPDYIEIRNTGEEIADLSGLTFSQSFFGLNGNQYVFPLNTVLQPGEYRIIYFSDYPHGINHASFPLRKNGEQIFLTGTAPNGANFLIDAVLSDRLNDDEALFRLGKNGDWRQGIATPGTTNIAAGNPILELQPDLESARLLFGTTLGQSYFIEVNPSLSPDSWVVEKEVRGDGFEHSHTLPTTDDLYIRVHHEPKNEN